MSDHTLLPLLTAFLPPDRKQRLLEHHKGSAQIGMWGLAGLHGSRRSRRGICTDCLKEQYVELGFGIWQRLFFMASIFACPKHEKPLFTFCPFCDRHTDDKYTWRPALECPCGGSLQTIAKLDDRMLEVAIGNATALSHVLNQGLPIGINSSSIVNSLADQLKATSASDIKEAMNEIVGQEILDLYGFSENTYNRLTVKMAAKKPLRNSVQNLLVIQALLGGLEKYTPLEPQENRNLLEETNISVFSQTRKHHSLTMEKYLESLKSWSKNEIILRTEHCRRRILSKLIRNPNSTRTQLNVLGLSREILHMKAIDPDWLQCRAPFARKNGAGVHPRYMSRERVRAIALTIYKMYLHLISTQPTKRILRAALLSTTAFRKDPRYLNSIPEIAFILDAIEDNDERFFSRKAAALAAQVESTRPHPLYSDPNWYTHQTLKGTTLARFKTVEKWLDDAE